MYLKDDPDCIWYSHFLTIIKSALEQYDIPPSSEENDIVREVVPKFSDDGELELEVYVKNVSHPIYVLTLT